MNTTHSSKTLVHFAITMLAMLAVIAIALLGTGGQPQPRAAEIVKLERVVIVGKRMSDQPVVVAQLPRVVITGRSSATVAEPTLASAGLLKARAL